MLFSSWNTIFRILIIAPLSYAALVIMLRISGKRTLSQLNAFDFVVTVAFGSTLATTILSTNIGLTDGVLALGLLIFLQLIVARYSPQLKWSKEVIKSDPRLLFQRGNFLETAMEEERVSREEILQAIRSQGMSSLDGVDFVVLETNGNLSVISKSAAGDASALENIRQPGAA